MASGGIVLLNYVDMSMRQEAAIEWCDNMFGSGSVTEQEAFIAGIEYAEKWINIYEHKPPLYEPVLVLFPDGEVSISSWRPAYSIFTCEEKGKGQIEYWRYINLPK